MSLDQFAPDIEQLIRTDTNDDTDRAWIVATYLSLRAAESLGHNRHAFAKLSGPDRTAALLEVVGGDLLKPSTASHAARAWRAGHFFNNAVLRLVALTEVRLKVLFKERTGMRAPNDYWWLAEWYEDQFKQKLTHLNLARQQMNKFKHTRDEPVPCFKFETADQGEKALAELLCLCKIVLGP